MQLRGHRGVRRGRSARLPGGQEPGDGRARRARPCATGCWRPSVSSRRSASPGPARRPPPRRAHGAHYLSVAETAAPHLEGPGQGAWLARLDADRANLRRAAEQAAGRPDGTGQVLRLGVALRRYWLARDRGEEAMALLMPALDRPEARADPQLYGSALATAALAGRYTDAARAGSSASRPLGSRAGSAADGCSSNRSSPSAPPAITPASRSRGPAPGGKRSSWPARPVMRYFSARA